MAGSYHCFVSVQVRGQALDFESITQQLGFEPTRTVRRGDRGRVLSDGWIYKLEQPDSTLSDLLDALEERIAVSVEAVREIATRHQVSVWCSHQTDLAMSGFDLSPRNLAFLAGLGVPLTVSIFSNGEVRD